MQQIDKDKYKKNQEKIKNFIIQQLAESNKKKQVGKVSPLNSIQSNKKIQGSSSNSSPFGSSNNLKQSQSSGNGGIRNSNNSSNNNNNINININSNKISQKQKSPLISSSSELQSRKFPLQFNKKQQSIQQSGGINSNSDKSKISENLKQYCQINGTKIQQKLAINQQLISLFKSQNNDKVILLGVQKPHDISKQRLYLCTYMQFFKQQITSMKFKAKDYQNQLDQFLNVIRYPFALAIIGQKITDMKLHYIKFLLEMNSPLPLVIIFNQTAPDKSLVIRMSDRIIADIENTNIIEIDRLDKQIGMKDKSRYKCLNFKDIYISKDKSVTTKQLTRKLNKSIIQNDMAIMVEKTAKPEQKLQSNSNNLQEFIKQLGDSNNNSNSNNNGNSGDFQFKVHAKFISSTPLDFFVYLINDQKQLNKRKKFKGFSQIIDFVKTSDSPCAIGYTMKTIDKKITAQLFVTCLRLGQKCPIMVLRLKNLSLNKVAFLSLKDGVTQADLNSNPVSFKQIQGNQSSYLNVLLIGHKGNMNTYQGKNALQEI